MSARLLELRCTFRAGRRDGTTVLLVDAELFSAGGSEVLAQGASVWERSDAFAGPVDKLLWKWLGDPAGSDEADPANMPDTTLAFAWGRFLTDALCDAAGEEALGRLVEHAASGDDATARLAVCSLGSVAGLPVETTVWPAGTPTRLFDHGVSIVRIADGLGAPAAGPIAAPAPVAGREGGRYVSLLAASDFDRGLNVSGFCDALGAVQRRRGLMFFESLEPELGLRDDTSCDLDAERTLRQRLLRADPDLVVCCGHGTRARGLHLDVDDFLSGEQIASAVRGGPSTVVLAMCGSATPGPDGEPSTSDLVVRSGVGITIGLQGGDAPEPHVLVLVRRLLKDVSAARLARGAFGLATWERAMLACRQQIGDADLLPVMTVHPSLLAHRHTGVVPRRAVAWDRGAAGSSASARPWYVPGQVVWFRDGDETLRVPLPVDVGAVVVVSLGAEGEGPALTGTSLPEADLRALAHAWPLPDGLTLDVRRKGAAPPDGWATRSAELSAVLRALSLLLDELPPAGAIDMLNAIVVSEWGAHDAAARAVRLRDGRSVARFAGWPEAGVRAYDDRPIKGDMLEAQRGELPVPAHSISQCIERIESGFDGLCELVIDHGNAVRDDDRLLARFQGVLAYSGSIAIPHGAALVAVEPTVHGWVRLAGMTAREPVDASDLLRG